METEVTDLEGLLSFRREKAEDTVSVEEETLDLLIFEINHSWFAFPGPSIREILPKTEIFFVPGCIPSVEGVINVRGDIETVINLNDLFGAPPQASSTWAILLGKTAAMQSGIRVDKVIDVVTIAKTSVREAPVTLEPQLQGVVTGMLLYRETPVSVLGLEPVFELYARRLS